MSFPKILGVSVGTIALVVAAYYAGQKSLLGSLPF